MNHQNIRIFMAIVEQGSISGAAKSLHYTHPTVSESLKQLESELGVQLIIRERGVRRVVLTAAGQSFLPIAQQWMEVNRRINHFRQAQRQKVLRLAAGVAAHEYIVPQITRRLMMEAPGLELRLLSMKSQEIRDGIMQQSFDVAIYFGKPIVDPLVTTNPFFEEERCILCRADTVLPDRPLTAEDLDPNYEVRYSKAVSRDTRLWIRENLPQEAKCWAQVPDWLSMHNYLTDPRCWALMPTGTALQQISRRPGQLAVRQVLPKPAPRLCSLLIAKSYADKEALQALYRACGQYADEIPYLKNTLPPMEQL
ncbi:MAG: LysR family transcriptional regulator [Ruminococcaceae bacterium]|nr:LysR family transcriptional regulator [Oscillospiraceae bacterium]